MDTETTSKETQENTSEQFDYMYMQIPFEVYQSSSTVIISKKENWIKALRIYVMDLLRADENYTPEMLVEEMEKFDKQEKPEISEYSYAYTMGNDGGYFITFLEPDSELRTLVHEASHGTDVVMSFFGLEGTEERAYMTEYIFSNFIDALNAYNENFPKEKE